MPELPEVETLRRGLQKYVVGKTIENVNNLHPGTLQGNPSYILGQKIVSARRIGKVLILDFANNYHMAIHVKLTANSSIKTKIQNKFLFQKTKWGVSPINLRT